MPAIRPHQPTIPTAPGPVIPAKAGIQDSPAKTGGVLSKGLWIPAFAGMTARAENAAAPRKNLRPLRPLRPLGVESPQKNQFPNPPAPTLDTPNHNMLPSPPAQTTAQIPPQYKGNHPMRNPITALTKTIPPAASGQRPAASGQRPAASGQRPAASGHYTPSPS